MKSRLTPVYFDIGKIYNLDGTYSRNKQPVVVLRKEGSKSAYGCKLFTMKEKLKEKKRRWYVGFNPLPMLPTDNLLLQRAAREFRMYGINTISTYHDRIIYR